MTTPHKLMAGAVLVVATALLGSFAIADDDKKPATNEEKASGKMKKSERSKGSGKMKPVDAAAGRDAFVEVARVLQSPRCMNCHPQGDAPLQTDESRPHRYAISRLSDESGMACGTCHQTENSEAMGIPGGPPGAPNWHLPPRDTPMVFEGHSPTTLCQQLKDPEQNGGKSGKELLHHVSEDALVLWGWNPGGNRTTPPLSHNDFVEAFATWVHAGMPCP